MQFRLSVFPVILALSACTLVSSIQPVVSDKAAIAEPQLLGDWTLIQDRDTSRLRVTQEPSPAGSVSTVYTIRLTNGTDSARYQGRIGPLTRDILVLEATADETSLWEQYAGFILTTYMQIVVRRSASGLEFALFNTDSLNGMLASHRMRTPYIVRGEHPSKTMFLTADPAALRAALASFATRPGALVPLRRAGHQLTIPRW